MAETYIGGFHAVIAALEDGERKPREILLADTRKDQRAQRLLEIAAKARVTVRNVGRDTLDLYAPGLKHQARNRGPAKLRILVASQPPCHGDRIEDAD